MLCAAHGYTDRHPYTDIIIAVDIFNLSAVGGRYGTEIICNCERFACFTVSRLGGLLFYKFIFVAVCRLYDYAKDIFCAPLLETYPVVFVVASGIVHVNLFIDSQMEVARMTKKIEMKKIRHGIVHHYIIVWSATKAVYQRGRVSANGH